MFNWMNDFASSIGSVFNVNKGVQPDTPLSEPDAIKTGGALLDLGYFGKKGESEFGLSNSVKAFQEANNLKVDGVIKPKGETENAISQALQQKRTFPPTLTPSPVHVKKTGEKSYQARASFQAPPKPQPLPTKQPETTENALRDLLKNPLYQQKDPAYLKYVQGEYKRAYVGNVQYDETGKMIQAQPQIKPNELRAFSQAQQPVVPKSLNSSAKKGNNLSYEEMQALLAHDVEAFERLPQADRSAYHAYMTKKHSSLTPNQNLYEQAQQERNALIAGREAGAGTYVREAFMQPLSEAYEQTKLAFDMLRGQEPNYQAFEKKMKTIQGRIPAGYQSAQNVKQVKNIAQGALKGASVVPILAPVASLQTAGETASQLAKAGVSLQGQRIGAALMGMSSMFGKNATKAGLNKVNHLLEKNFGTDLRQLTPGQLEVIGDTILGEAWSLGPKGIVENVIIMPKKQ